MKKLFAIFQLMLAILMLAACQKQTDCTHEWGEWETVTAATCVEGSQKRICKKCEESETKTIAATGVHAFGEWQTVTEATCQPGERKHTCKICQQVQTESVNPNGVHNYVNGACAYCGEKKPTEGLIYSDLGDSYYVLSIGTATDTDIVIPSIYEGKPVVGIVNEAFVDCETLTSIFIPSSVTYIGHDAFSGCVGLITEENGVYYVDKWVVGAEDGITSAVLRTDTVGVVDYAFADQWLLEIVTLPFGMVTIGAGAFEDCGKLTSLTIPDSVTTVGVRAFFGCEALWDKENGVYYVDGWVVLCDEDIESVTVRAGTIGIASGAFLACDVKSVIFPEGVTYIGDLVFLECYYLTNLSIPASVTKIGVGIVLDSSNLKSVVVANGNSCYHNAGNCLIETATGKVLWGYGDGVIPDYVKGIAPYAFYNCKSLMSVTIPAGVTYIGTGAFFGCTSLLEVYNLSSLQIVAGGKDNGYIAYYAMVVHDKAEAESRVFVE